MGKNNNGGKPKLGKRTPKSLEPLLTNPNYLNDLASTLGRKQGTTELDSQIPRIVKDICDPFTNVDMNKYGIYLIQDPCYTRLTQMLNHLYMINHQYVVTLTYYINQINMPGQLGYYQQNVSNIQYGNPMDIQNNMGYNPNSYINVTVQEPIFSQNILVDIPMQQPPQQGVYMDQFTDIDMIKGLLNQAKINEQVYFGALNAIITFHDYYCQGYVVTAPIDQYINLHQQDYKFITAPDLTGVEYYEKKQIIEAQERKEKRDNNNRERRERYHDKSVNKDHHRNSVQNAGSFHSNYGRNKQSV